MAEERYYPSSSLIDGQWLIAGGSDSTEVWKDDLFIPGPFLPESIDESRPCQVRTILLHVPCEYVYK